MDSLRDNIQQILLNSNKKHFVLECATGVGKTYLALQKINQLYSQNCKILIVIPRNVLIQNWIEEFKKWHYEDMLSNVTFVTYVSLPKMAGSWDIVVFDECHHISDRCAEALMQFYINHAIFLSATISKDVAGFIEMKYNSYKELQWIKVNTKTAIDNKVLPDPLIIIIPLSLDNTKANYLYTPKKPKNKSLKSIVIPYADKWKYKNYKGLYQIKCTQRQYYNELSGIVNWYKKKSYNPAMKNLWLHKAGERLQWLSWQKQEMVNALLKILKDRRKIVFCSNIEQTEALGIPCVNSKVGTDNLDKFNKGKIDSISCVNMLDEGCNLLNCQIGIFMMLNSSNRMQVQKLGRLLRHEHPVVIIPYITDTRDEEIMDKMINNYDTKKVVITNSKDIILNKINSL